MQAEGGGARNTFRSPRMILNRSDALRDPRYYQLAALSCLAAYGIIGLDFEVTAVQAMAGLGGALGFQWLFTRLYRLPAFDPKSALISGLSLTLLLRSNSLWLVLLAAFIAIASKFVLRWRGRHIFNPTCFGIVVLVAGSDAVWVSAGQWGSAALLGLAIVCLGMTVVHRAARSDVSLVFLASYAALLFARALWLGDPFAIPLRQMQNGALLLFAFFMISDPKTTPHSRLGRLVFAALVAFGALFVQFKLFENNGLLWSLSVFALLVPVLDKFFPGKPYEWHQAFRSHVHTKGGSHGTPTLRPGVLSGASRERITGAGLLRFLRR